MSDFKRIEENEPLPLHVKDTDGNVLNYGEIRVRFICEQIFKTRILNSDRPDLYAENKQFGIEVTSANDIPCIIHKNVDGKLKPQKIANYNCLEGMKHKDMCQNRTIREELCFASMSANADVYIEPIMKVLESKLKKLNGENGEAYAEYPTQILYVTSIADTVSLSINDFMKLFQCMRHIQNGFTKSFTLIFVECIDCLIKLDFRTGHAYFMPDIFKLIPFENKRAREYVRAKHNGEKAPDSPAEEVLNKLTEISG